jgi:hypothetical protein
MPSHRNAAEARAGSRATPTSTGDGETAAAEEIHIRSYDHDRAYDLRLEVRVPGGDVAYADRYYLQPGASESEIDIVAPGGYRVEAVLDNDDRRSRRCRIGSAADHTAVVEVGNGVLSLTEGLR